MSVPGVFDALLILLILAYFSFGWVTGLVRSAFSMAGVAAGGVAAFFAIPTLGSWIGWPAWRLPLILAGVLVLVIAGQVLGALIGRTIGSRVEGSGLSFINRIGGAILNAVVAALIAYMVAFSINGLGVPLLSQAISGSTVLKTIEQVTPTPLRSGMALLRDTVVQEGIPRIIAAANGISDPSIADQPLTVPELEPQTPSLEIAAQSVVKITGVAIQCGQNQSGSGFVVAPDRVLTNAHVVAGVSEPVIEVPGEGAFSGRVVYFDAMNDLAVVSVSGLSAPTLAIGQTLAPGSDAAFGGYPLGGPLQLGAAGVEDVTEVTLHDIYGNNPHSMEVYRLAANVQSGNSGGPLFSSSAQVVGVIFAKSTSVANLGYAHTVKELSPLAAAAETFTKPVSSGVCIQH